MMWGLHVVGPNMHINFLSVDVLRERPSVLSGITTWSSLKLCICCLLYKFLLSEWSFSFCLGYFIRHGPSAVILFSESKIIYIIVFGYYYFTVIFSALKFELLNNTICIHICKHCLNHKLENSSIKDLRGNRETTIL